MKESECMEQVSRLLAAFPSSKATEQTAIEYARSLVKLEYAEALRDAVTALIEHEHWLPPIALVRETYSQFRERYLPPALPMPDVSDEQAATSRQLVKAMTGHLGARGREGHARLFSECSHPACVEARALMPEVSDEVA